MGISAYVLSRTLPSARVRFGELLRLLGDEKERRFVLSELNHLLSSLGRFQFQDTVSERPPGGLSRYLQNYVAAMVEHAANRKRLPVPTWLRDIAPLEEPHFVVSLSNLRLHLLRSSPVPFRRRNIFVDSGVGDRV